MFYEVRILDSEGKVKKVLSSKKLSSSYWGDFYDKIKSKSISRSGLSKGKIRPATKPGKPDQDKFDDVNSLTDEG